MRRGGAPSTAGIDGRRASDRFRRFTSARTGAGGACRTAAGAGAAAGGRLCLCRSQRRSQRKSLRVRRRLHLAHALAAPARDGLDQDRVADFGGCFESGLSSKDVGLCVHFIREPGGGDRGREEGREGGTASVTILLYIPRLLPSSLLTLRLPCQWNAPYSAYNKYSHGSKEKIEVRSAWSAAASLEAGSPVQLWALGAAWAGLGRRFAVRP